MSGPNGRLASGRDGRAASGRAASGRDGRGYTDLQDYAAIGDGRTAALVATDGRIDWFPLPDLDSHPAFAALLDSAGGGHIALCPDEPFQTQREYLPDTNVLTTTFHTDSGAVRITDSLNSGLAGRLPWVELARRIEGLSGSVQLTGRVAPGTCLGTVSPWVQDTTHGLVLRVDDLTLAVRADADSGVEHDDRSVTVRYRTSAGSRHLLGLVATEGEPLLIPDPATLDRGIDRTVQSWQRWADELAWTGEWPDAVRRSALALKILLYAPTGAIAAAATTSLPESAAGGKNWDYRYAWIRDTAYTLDAMFTLGLHEETHAAVSWLLSTIYAHGPAPEPFYTLSGGRPAGRRTFDVEGWRSIGPVVAGNEASSQLQLGVFGDLFGIVRRYVDAGNVLDARTGRQLAGIADRACDQWQLRDAGMWELPEERHYTTSKLGCWQALSGAVHLAELGEIPGDPSRWRTEARRIRDYVETECFDAARGCYTFYPGSTEVDASILLHAISGFDRGPRMSSTLDVLRAELGAGPHLYRYSGMADEESTFVACSFWMVAALRFVGRTGEARVLMEQLLACANDVGLYSEMIDADTGDFAGNLPQALSHLALITAAASFIAP